MTDARSALTVNIMDANPRAYERLVVAGAAPALARELLDGVTPDQLLTAPIQDSVAAQAMRAGLWLWHDALDQCHAIVQKSPQDLIAKRALNVLSAENKGHDAEATSTLAFWHAIMHRREGDFSNSKYWYARCANHPAMPPLAVQAAGVVNAMPADKSLLRIVMSGWSPNAFVDLVEAVHDQPSDPRHALAVTLQRLEWQTLFDHCTRAASM